MLGIVENKRKGLLQIITTFLKKNNIPHTTIKIDKPENRIKFIINKNIKVLYFSNGSDDIDTKFINFLKKQTIYNKLKLYFSEFAWLPWKNCIYLLEGGIANLSYLFKPNFNYKLELKDNIPNNKIELRYLDDHKNIPSYKKYILIPLQVDGDSKLKIGSPYFKKCIEFVNHITKIIPDDYIILFKNHPHNRNKVIISQTNRVIDITTHHYNKKKLIESAEMVIGINSTFLIESIYLNKKVISYGYDIFCNKDIVFEANKDSKFKDFENFEPNNENIKYFINYLFTRQIYLNNHQLNQGLVKEIKEYLN